MARWRPHHLDQRLFHAALTPAVSLDDRRLKRLLAQLRHLQLHFARLGLQAALIVTGPGVLARFAALVPVCAAQAVRLRIQHRVQGFLNRPAHHLAQVVPDPSLIDVDHVPHRLAFSLVHLRSSHSERNHRQNQMCERSCTLSNRFGRIPLVAGARSRISCSGFGQDRQPDSCSILTICRETIFLRSVIPDGAESFAFADPGRRLGVSYVMNRMGQNLVGDPRGLALISAVLKSADAG